MIFGKFRLYDQNDNAILFEVKGWLAGVIQHYSTRDSNVLIMTETLLVKDMLGNYHSIDSIHSKIEEVRNAKELAD